MRQKLLPVVCCHWLVVRSLSLGTTSMIVLCTVSWSGLAKQIKQTGQTSQNRQTWQTRLGGLGRLTNRLERRDRLAIPNRQSRRDRPDKLFGIDGLYRPDRLATQIRWNRQTGETRQITQEKSQKKFELIFLILVLLLHHTSNCHLQMLLHWWNLAQNQLLPSTRQYRERIWKDQPIWEKH